MPWFAPGTSAPDPTLVTPAQASGDGWYVMQVHPWRVVHHRGPGAEAVAAWACGRDLLRPAPTLEISCDGGDELDLVLDFGTSLEGRIHGELTLPGHPLTTIFTGESAWEAREIGLPSTCREQRPRKAQWATTPDQPLAIAVEWGGFRFVRVRILGLPSSGTVRIALRVEARFAAPAPAGSFTCADARIERLFHAARYTALACTRPEAIWDGPKRDRLGWYGDARIAHETLSWTYDLPKPGLCMLETLDNTAWANHIPNYSFDAVAMLRRHLLRFGTEGAETAWRRAQAFLTWVLTTQVDEAGRIVRRDGVPLFFDIGFTDWTPMPLGGRLEELFCLQASWASCLDDAAACARMLGEDGTAYAQAAHRQRALLLREFCAPGQGFHHTLNQAEPLGTPWRQPFPPGLHARLSYDDGVAFGPSGPSRHSAARAAFAGLLTDPRIASEVSHVLARPESPVLPTPITTYYWYYTLMAQAAAGDVTGAWRAMQDYFLPMLEQHDSATIWEVYEPAVQGLAAYSLGGWPKSLCHGWGSAPVPMSARWLLGIDITGPGMTRLHLDPRLDLACEATIPSPHGPVRITSDGRTTRYRLPRGITATIADPARAVVEPG